jgi:predicted phage terminase large subunit-like protein
MPSYEPQGAQLRAFSASNAFLRALIGPIYGGRKSCCINDIVRRATIRRWAKQTRWRWVVVAPIRRELERFVIPTIKNWLEVGEYDDKGRHFALHYRLEDGVQRLIEIDFLGMDDAQDRKRFGVATATGVWLDDARNLSESVLEDAMRIAGTYPTPLAGGAMWSGVICSSRMPPPGHWLVRRPEDPGDLQLFRQPGGRTAEAENLPALRARGFSYEAFAGERDADWIRVNIDGELGQTATEAAAEAERAAAREQLTRWVGLTMPDLTPARHHELLIAKLEALARREIKRLMFFLPPGSAKSTYGSVLFPSWYIGNYPTHSVIAASHSKELAERFGRRVRNIVGSPIFRETFGFGLSGDSGAAGRWETARGGEYFAVGVDASVTGRRAHLGIIDDPVKGRAEADSATVRQHVWEWYKADFWTRLVPEATLLYIGTRWHEDDLAGRLLEDAKAGGEQWEVVSLPAIVEEEGDALGRIIGERLWPEWYTPEMLEVAQRDTRNWSALWQQRPMPESGDYFQNDWVRWYDSAPPRDRLRTYGASDYAVKANAGDWTVHLVAGIDPNDDLYLLDLWRKQTASNEWVESVIDLMDLWKTITWAEEAGQIEKGVGPFLTKRQLERKIYAVRKQYSSAADKAVRAQAIRGRVAMGKVYLPKRAPWAPVLLDEMLRFPAGKADDQVDGLALLGRMLDEMVPGSKPKPAAEEPRGVSGMTLDELWKLDKRYFKNGRFVGDGRPLRI